MYRKNVAGQFICFHMLLTATGAVATGLSPAVRRCIDGTFAAGTGTVTEDSAGFYKYAMSQADTNGNDIAFDFTATGAMPICQNIVTTACDPTVGTSFGISNIDATVSSRMASYTQPTGFLAATFPGTVASPTNITSITGNITGNLTGSVGSVTGAVGSVTGAVGSVTGAVGSVTARVTANTDQVNGDATAAANLAKTTAVIGRCTAGAGGTTTSVVSSACAPTGIVLNQFKGRIITFDANTTTTALRGQSTDITASSAAAAPTFTVTALTTAPASGDTFSIT
jgi:hypothetical protein